MCACSLVQTYEERRGQAGIDIGCECACSRIISLSKNMSLSSYVSMSFLFHTGLTDIQFHILYTVACPMTS